MKIELLVTLPIASKHGATKGRVFDVIGTVHKNALSMGGGGGRIEKYQFIGDAAETCCAFPVEVKELPGESE